MSKLKYILLCFIISTELFSQGFDWQYSIRYPTSSPRLFLGGSAAYELSSCISDINFAEDKIPCCKFENGSANGYKIGICSEYWLPTGISAVSGNVAYHNKEFTLKAYPDPVYYKNDTLYTEIININKIDYIELSAYYKYRIARTHLTVSGGMLLSILTSNSYTFKEQITNLNHKFNNGETSRDIATGSIPDLSIIIINPSIRIGYDHSIGPGIYASAYFDFSVNANSLVKNDKWHSYNFSLGISILKGID